MPCPVLLFGSGCTFKRKGRRALLLRLTGPSHLGELLSGEEEIVSKELTEGVEDGYVKKSMKQTLWLDFQEEEKKQRLSPSFIGCGGDHSDQG